MLEEPQIANDPIVVSDALITREDMISVNSVSFPQKGSVLTGKRVLSIMDLGYFDLGFALYVKWTVSCSLVKIVHKISCIRLMELQWLNEHSNSLKICINL